MQTGVKIANGSAFWGDDIDASVRLVSQVKDLDFLTLDYLSELTLSIMAIQKEKDPKLGYAKDFVKLVEKLIPFWKEGCKVKLIANAGGLNPIECARACHEVLTKQKIYLKIGVVTGDDVLATLKEDVESPLNQNLETKKYFKYFVDKFVSANAYLGAPPIVDALKENAQIVITGRIADPTLTVAPCIYSFGWEMTDYDLLASATIAGHLIECGTQVTGGITTDWLSLKDPENIGFPVVEMEQDGSFTITKPYGTGGAVNEYSVKEQLLYEIQDPDNYLTPDVTVSFLSLKLQVENDNRIHITGAKGKAPTRNFKVSGTYRDGFRAEGYLALFGQEVQKKARMCGKIVLNHLERAGYFPESFHVEVIGSGDLVPHVFEASYFPEGLECMLRIAVSDTREDVVERFTKEMASLVTSGPQGVTGYTAGRPNVRPVFGFWPCLIEKSRIRAKVDIL